MTNQTFPAQRWLTRAQVCARLGISRSTSYRILPAPTRFGPRTLRWSMEAIEDFERYAEANSPDGVTRPRRGPSPRANPTGPARPS